MNKFLLRLPQLGLLALLCGIMLGCKPEADNAFSVKVAGVGPEYVEINVTAPNPVQIAYIVDTKEQLMNNPAVMFTKGEVITVRPNDTFRVSGGLHEKTKYWLYLVAKLDAQNYSEIYTIPFTTTEYDFDELLTVTEQAYDGYNMRITVPDETLDRKNAIRYNQCCIMMYNYMSGSDDYSSLLYNGGRYVTESTTLHYSEDTNWHETGSDSDGDGEIDLDTYYNPVSSHGWRILLNMATSISASLQVGNQDITCRLSILHIMLKAGMCRIQWVSSRITTCPVLWTTIGQERSSVSISVSGSRNFSMPVWKSSLLMQARST